MDDAFDLNAPKKVYEFIATKYQKLDILINNAGVLLFSEGACKN